MCQAKKWVLDNIDNLYKIGVEEVHLRSHELFFIVPDRRIIENKSSDWKSIRNSLKEICFDVSIGTCSSFKFCGGSKWGWELLTKVEI